MQSLKQIINQNMLLMSSPISLFKANNNIMTL